MGMITTGDATSSGGRLSLASLITPQEQPRQTNIIETVEKILSNPAMKPIIEQGGRLIGAYADKLTLDNQTRIAQMTKQQNAQSTGHTVVFGAGSENE